MNRTVQTRWAAIGAAIAVTLGAGGMGLVRAASSSDAPGLTPITACRLVDTRPEFQVGPRSTPLGPADTYTVAAEGEQGDCNLPSAATALALNVTAVDATLDTFLTLWDDGELPNASSLNPSPGQPPTPNAVTVPLSDDGTFNIYNFQGSVHVVIDVVGYHQPHDHDDRYYTEPEVDAALAGKADASDVYTQSQIDGMLKNKPSTRDVYTQAQIDGLLAAQRVIHEHASTDDAPEIPQGVETSLTLVTIDAPTDGSLHIAGGVSASPNDGYWSCRLTVDGTLLLSSVRGTPGACSTEDAVDVTAGSYNVRLVGVDNGGAVQTLGASLSVLFVPDDAG